LVHLGVTCSKHTGEQPRQHHSTKVSPNPRKRLKERKQKKDVACCFLQQIPLPLSKQKPRLPGKKLRRVEELVLAVGCRLLAVGCWLLLLAAFFSTENEKNVTVCHD